MKGPEVWFQCVLVAGGKSGIGLLSHAPGVIATLTPLGSDIINYFRR